MLLLFLCLAQLVGFAIRRIKFNYTKKFKLYLILVFVFLSLFTGLVTSLNYLHELNIFIEIAAVSWVIIFCIIGFFNFNITIKFLFYWRLKKIFPFEGEDSTQREITLKKLSPFISLEKQKVYLIIRYGMNFIVYGFYMYLCVFIFKISNFTAPVLEKIQSHINLWSFINASNAVGLFSILLAILTICVPAQQKIVREAEREMMKRYNKSNLL
ncbi:hypothetical protein [Lysinibacillus capsici]|uniref:hypothetical protein n=1 Tax=Lysinibacillus capsici TaxID=2115968 RepID=UPI003D0326DA